MAHVFEIPDELYEKLRTVARERQQTPEALFQAWLKQVTTPPPSSSWGNEPPPTQEELQAHPFLRMIGSLSIGDPRLETEFNEVLAEAIADGAAETE
jgi:hypothetical protein